MLPGSSFAAAAAAAAAAVAVAIAAAASNVTFDAAATWHLIACAV